MRKELVTLIFGISLTSLNAFGDSGKYACTEVDVRAVATAPAVAKALNELSCDTTKPTNVAYDPTAQGSILLCCVQK
jgi:hypothetical protein